MCKALFNPHIFLILMINRFNFHLWGVHFKIQRQSLKKKTIDLDISSIKAEFKFKIQLARSFNRTNWLILLYNR